VSVRYTWGLAKDALPFLRYLAERDPDSVQAQSMLTDGYVQLGDYVSAIGALSKFVDQHPDRPGARAVGAVARLSGRATKVTRCCRWPPIFGVPMRTKGRSGCCDACIAFTALRPCDAGRRISQVARPAFLL
jgi:hypothetical protein